MKKPKGFTLIELLIVVAIIGILAAIAIPNFLQAQARAKISRCMADMKAVSLALEEYQVDNNKYPNPYPDPGFGIWLMVTNTPWSEYYPGRLLTTPVEYIGSIPIDTFNTARMDIGSDERVRYSFWLNVFDVPNETWDDDMNRATGGWFPLSPSWNLESVGPSLRWWAHDPEPQDPFAYFYDPTNGTLSVGMISLSNKGWISPREK